MEDYLLPDWGNRSKCHDWKNYVSDELRQIWLQLEPELRRLIAKNMQEIADQEHWE